MSSSFRRAVREVPALRSHIKSGLGAIAPGDKQRLRVENTRKLTGSLDLDESLAELLPDQPRWDYGVGYSSGVPGVETVHWIEIHPASDRDVSAVEAKLKWLKQWLGDEAPALATLPRSYVWVSSGRTRLTPASPGLRRLAQLGCRHVGHEYRIA